MKSALQIFTLFLLVDFWGCTDHNDHHPIPNLEASKTEKLRRMEERLLGRVIESSLLDAETTNNDHVHVAFLVSGLDCDSCLRQGFEFLKKEKSEIGDDLFSVVASNANIGALQLRMEYPFPIISDTQEKLRQELVYFQTPALLLLGPNRAIVDIYFPRDLQPDPEQAKFARALRDAI